MMDLCIYPILGCKDESSLNYNVLANTDDGSCIEIVLGCTQPSAFNYDSNANLNDGSCIAVVLGCTDLEAFNYNLMQTQMMDMYICSNRMYKYFSY